MHEAVALTGQANESNEAKDYTLRQISQILEKLDPPSLKALSEILNEQTKVILSGSNVASLGSFDSYPSCESDTASLTGSLTGSLLPHEEEQTALQKEPTVSQEKSTEAPLEQKQPSYVRYQGELFRVATCDNGLLSLRRAGLTKIVHRNVPLNQCDEIFYQ